MSGSSGIVLRLFFRFLILTQVGNQPNLLYAMGQTYIFAWKVSAFGSRIWWEVHSSLCKSGRRVMLSVVFVLCLCYRVSSCAIVFFYVP